MSVPVDRGECLPLLRGGAERSVKAAAGAASVLLALAGGLSAVAAPEKPTPQPAMFTAYLPPAEEHCCTIALPGGRIGFGMLTIPDPDEFREKAV